MTTEPPPAPKSRVSIKAIALLVAVFILGGVCGVGGTSIIVTKRLQSAFRENLRNPGNASGPADRMLDRLEDRLTKELDLTADEQAAVGEELDQTRAQLRDVRSGMGRDLRRISIGTIWRIGQRLPDEKRRKFRQIARQRLRPWGIDTQKNR